MSPGTTQECYKEPACVTLFTFLLTIEPPVFIQHTVRVGVQEGGGMLHGLVKGVTTPKPSLVVEGE